MQRNIPSDESFQNPEEKCSDLSAVAGPLTMAELNSPSARHTWWLAALAAILAFGFFAMDGDVEPNLADEGYLWYGMKALKAGQIPIRDFHSYDPGRYLWIAAWSYVLGDGLVSMRAACVIFQCIGIFCGLLTLRRLTHDWRILFLGGMMFVLWMVPTYKSFEQTIGLMAIYVGVRLIERPARKNYFLSGIFIGLMAIMGRNHGVYLVGAFGLMTVMITGANWRLLCIRLIAAGTGIVCGYIPQILMVSFIPGYYEAFLGSIAVIFRFGTNISLPVIWPWQALAEPDSHRRIYLFSMGIIYVGLVAFAVLSILQAWRIGIRGLAKYPVFVASTCVTLFYLHFTFSRSDLQHLAHSVPLWIVGVLALSFTLRADIQKWLSPTVIICLVGLSLSATGLVRGVFKAAFAPEGTYVEMSWGGQKMLTPKYEVGMLKLAEMMDALAQPGESISFIPYSPGLYPAVNRLCPTRQSYFLIPSLTEEEESNIAALKRNNVTWVLLQDLPIDGREDLRFRHTNPLTHAYLQNNFEVRGSFPQVKTQLLRLKE